ncbi:MAG: hypothetical protein HOO86_11975 [Bacteroidales bacterium]|nr:hypothetical protein [Bacteroidales bacterium]
MVRLVIPFFFCLVLSACNGSHDDHDGLPVRGNENPVFEFSDFETVNLKPYSWSNENTVIKMPVGEAHSGLYVSQVDSVNYGSYGFKERFINIADFRPQKILVDGWVYLPKTNDELKIFLIISKNRQIEISLSHNLKNSPLVLNQWNRFTAEFTIDKPVGKQHEVHIYGFSKKQIAYFDDFKITFL